ncbi:acyl-CoA reductase-like NAD-dependent aldehyde dehydrogenase [Sphingobium sp. OAS761]|nr:aldehyde dehydrogenase family protein [Sphingobium sp. OAS761]MCP1469159.1 acyl-CoA reductase-like NAD-dependent aldehyde dehydrogenase [Sphingobium sp. OAS761]
MEFKLLIDGDLVDGADSLAVINPATGEPFATCARADAAQLERAIAAAKRAFPTWRDGGQPRRQELLHKLADAMEARFEDFARLLTQEQGKPLAEAQFEVGGAIAAFRHFGAQVLHPETLVDEPNALVVEHYAPLGVVGCIVPWNFPMILLAIKVSIALSTGNTVVAKPAPTTPLTAALLGEVAVGILPPGVFNVIVDANDLGGMLSSHPDVAKISFTGSTATGRKVMASAASTLKRLTLELGGNDVAIVLDDADPAEVAAKIYGAATFNAGQTCMAAKRLYVPNAMLDDIGERLAALASATVLGDGLEPGTKMGPIQNKMQFDKLQDLMAATQSEGTVLTGGARLNRPGYFIQPAIVRDLADDARLVTEEQFGPLVPLLSYDTIEDVIARANASDYGLGGTVWGKDLDKAAAVARGIETGTVWINKHLDLRFDVPFGGVKQSGLGREQGQAGLKEFVDARIVNMAR